MSTHAYIAAAWAGSTLASLAVTPVVVHIARRFGVVDLPGARKVHQVPTPRLGGLAIAFSMIATAVPVFLLVSWNTGAIAGIDRARVATMLLCGLFVLAIGLIDDIVNLSARYKLLALVLAAIAFCSSGGVIHQFNLNGQYAIPLHWLAWPVTILWF